jgi:putative tryptophan/tyrosine transport system substrate-binding protein
MSSRRKFITLIGAAAAWPLAARAQTPPRMPRVGTASPNSRAFIGWVAFDQRMRELGYIEGQNLAFEFIDTGDRVDRVSEAIQELVRRKADVIVESSGTEQGLKMALAAAGTVPIVMIAIAFDPIALGHVSSLARPTGNVTGVYLRRPELVEKQMALLAQNFPGRTRLGALWDMNSSDMLNAAERVAASLNFELRPLKLENPPYDFVAAFRTLAQGGAQMLLILSSVYFNRDRPHIAGLAMQHRLPTMFSSKLYVEAGGLMSYGPSLPEMFRRTADYVDRIVRGARPSDLPVEQPTRFDLVVNVKTAKALGLDLPPTLLATADEVIE